MKAPSPATQVVFLSVIGLVLASVLAAVRRAFARDRFERLWISVGIFVWIGALSLPVATGAMQVAPVPRVMLFFLFSNAGALAFALSPIGGRIARSASFAGLVAFHAFRFPLELVLHSWAIQGVIPETMTWTGQNFDIVTGVLAAVLAPVIARSRKFGKRMALVFNWIGLGLLLNVMRVAVFSSPLPFAWGVQPPLELAFQLPFAWIVPICVAGALAGHVILFRANLGARL